MSFNNNTVSTTGRALEIPSLERLEPLGKTGQQEREQRRRRRKAKPRPGAATPDADATVYTPDGQVSGDDHGLRVRLSA